MSRGILINTIDTYIGSALYEEFLGENPSESAYEIYGTWHSKDDSFKPAFVKKMMKRSKPVLFRKYMREKMDCYIYDLHSGRLDDLKWAVWALTNEPLDSEKTLIVISSVLSWGGNEHKMKEVKPKKKKPVEEGGEEEQKEGGEEEKENEEEEKEEEEKENEDEKKEEEKPPEEKPPEEVKKEPKYDEDGNLIEEPEPPKKEFDEYGNEILVAELDENGNEKLPPNTEDFEYMFEDDYKLKKQQEKEEAERKAKEEQDKIARENGELPEEEKKDENNNEENKNDNGEEEKKDEEKKDENSEENKNEENINSGSNENSNDNKSESKEENEEGDEEDKKRVYKRVIKIKIIKPKIFKRIGFSEKEYKKRIPIEYYEKFKEYEDKLLNLKFENLNIYIVCAGLPYGGCETVFNYFFKSAWLQYPEELPYYGNGENLIPTIHIKDLAKIVKRLAEGKSESPYIFAIDKTKDKTLKNLISSISINIGSGKTQSIPYDKEAIKNLALKKDDFFIDKTKYEKNKLVMNITKHELSWTRFLGIDVMLNPSKFIDEEFDWYCKEGIPKNYKKLLDEFCSYRYLRPLKIIINCQNQEYRQLYAEKISKFYNIPILNYDLIMSKLNLNREDLTEEEIFMNEKYFKLQERIKFLDEHPDFKNEANELLYNKDEILFEALKYLLNSNAAVNRGYVLEGMPVNNDEIKRLYYYQKELPPAEGEEEEKPEEEEEVEEEEEKKDEEPEKKEEEPQEKKEDENAEEKEKNDDENAEEKEKNDEENAEEKEKNDEEAKKPEEEEEKKPEENAENPENPEGEDGTKKKKKKKKPKKIKPKKYKTKFEKKLIPESVITLNKIDQKEKQVDNIYWEVEHFYQDNNIEILNLVYEDEKKDDPEEIFELMRIYLERNGRPFNYFAKKDEDINVNRIDYVEEKQKAIEKNDKEIKDKEDKIKNEKEDQYWKKMNERLEVIQKDMEHLEQSDKVSTRKFLLVNIMPTLTKGLLEVCKINPIDPVDYLADFLFNNSNMEGK